MKSTTGIGSCCPLASTGRNCFAEAFAMKQCLLGLPLPVLFTQPGLVTYALCSPLIFCPCLILSILPVHMQIDTSNNFFTLKVAPHCVAPVKCMQLAFFLQLTDFCFADCACNHIF